MGNEETPMAHSCVQSHHVTGTCDICKKTTAQMHLPCNPRRIYCDKHCPACQTSAAPSCAFSAARRKVAPAVNQVSHYNDRTARVLAAAASFQG